MKPLNKKNYLLKDYISRIDCKNVYPRKKIHTYGLL